MTTISKPIFSFDWTSQVRDTWASCVFPHLDRTKPIRWLEIGSFEGRSTLWTVENLLQMPGSQIVCVDVWRIWERCNDQSNLDYEANFDLNTSGLCQVVKRKGESRMVLPTLEPGTFHGAYIDGSHDELDVLSDARMVRPLLRPGAVVVFDDYEWPGGDGVKLAATTLLREWGEDAVVVHTGYQLVVRFQS